MEITYNLWNSYTEEDKFKTKLSAESDVFHIPYMAFGGVSERVIGDMRYDGRFTKVIQMIIR